MNGQLFVFSAPSGTGKSSIIDALKERIDGLTYSVSYTSRKPRKTEREGVHYHFVNRKDFLKMIERNDFLEWAEVYKDYYGTSLSELGKKTSSGMDVLLDLDPQGAKNVKRHFDDSVLIYILPPSLDILEKRLRARDTDSEDVIGGRIENAIQEIKNAVWYDYIIVNQDLEKAIDDATAIIVAQRKKSNRQAGHLKRLIDPSQP